MMLRVAPTMATGGSSRASFTVGGCGGDPFTVLNRRPRDALSKSAHEPYHTAPARARWMKMAKNPSFCSSSRSLMEPDDSSSSRFDDQSVKSAIEPRTPRRGRRPQGGRNHGFCSPPTKLERSSSLRRLSLFRHPSENKLLAAPPVSPSPSVATSPASLSPVSTKSSSKKKKSKSRESADAKRSGRSSSIEEQRQRSSSLGVRHSVSSKAKRRSSSSTQRSAADVRRSLPKGDLQRAATRIESAKQPSSTLRRSAPPLRSASSMTSSVRSSMTLTDILDAYEKLVEDLDEKERARSTVQPSSSMLDPSCCDEAGNEDTRYQQK